MLIFEKKTPLNGRIKSPKNGIFSSDVCANFCVKQKHFSRRQGIEVAEWQETRTGFVSLA